MPVDVFRLDRRLICLYGKNVTKRIEWLQSGVEAASKSAAKHVESVMVREKLGINGEWDSVVEVFEVDHPMTKRAYAWGYSEGSEDRVLTMLQIPPVTCPASAVRVAFASGEMK